MNLLSMPSGVQKEFKCIICTKSFGSKAWVKRHFATHKTIPYSARGHRQGFLPAYTHPSCWPAADGFSWRRQNAVLANKLRLEAENAAYETIEDHMVYVAALTKKEYEVKEEIKRLADWWWWWDTQGDDIKQAIKHAPPGPLNIQGKRITT